MKKLFTALLLLFLFSCKESGVQFAKPSTFVRYFSGGFEEFPQTIVETADKGFVILSNSRTSSTGGHYRIKVIKTDAYGNQQWQKLFPEPGVSTPNFQGFGITAIKDNTGTETGYLIVGDSIYSDPSNSYHSLLMIQVDKDGNEVRSATKPLDSVIVRINNTDYNLQVTGIGVAQSKKNSNFYVTGHGLSPQLGVGSADMFVTEIDATTLNMLWYRAYGQGSDVKLIPKIFQYKDSLYWGGTFNKSQMFFTQARPNTNSEDARTYPDGTVSTTFTCNDICEYSWGYALVGSYGPANAGNTGTPFGRIAYYLVNDKLDFTDSATFQLPGQPATNIFEVGNSLCATNDGNLVLLGTVSASSSSNPDYYLTKIDLHGTTLWKKQFGGQSIDLGVKVIQASDGGLIILGSSKLANLESIFMMKTDSEGNIQ